MKRIGLITKGTIEKSIVRNLLAKGYTIYIYCTDYKKAFDIVDEKLIFCHTIRECKESCETIITIRESKL